MGPMYLQGGHHEAVKSMSKGLSLEASIAASNSAFVFRYGYSGAFESFLGSWMSLMENFLRPPSVVDRFRIQLMKFHAAAGGAYTVLISISSIVLLASLGVSTDSKSKAGSYLCVICSPLIFSPT